MIGSKFQEWLTESKKNYTPLQYQKVMGVIRAQYSIQDFTKKEKIRLYHSLLKEVYKVKNNGYTTEYDDFKHAVMYDFVSSLREELIYGVKIDAYLEDI